MLKQLRRSHKADQGFTLIELLIVVVVLGILSAIVVFGIATFKSDSTSSACKTDKASVNSAVQAYLGKTGAYPAPLTGTASADSTARIGVLVSANYLQSAPSSTDYTITLGPGGDLSSSSC